VAGAAGTFLGLGVAVLAVSLVIGQAAWHGASAGRLLTTALLATVAGALTTGVRLLRIFRSGRQEDVAIERRILESGWRPAWLRARLDLVAIAGGIAILAVNVASGGLKQTPVQGPSVALSFYVLLAPLLLWVGLTLLAVRVLLGVSARRVRPERSGPLPSWSGAAVRWLARRPARTAVALVLGALAVAFATEVVTFVATYRDAKTADAHAAFGSDLRLTPEPSDAPRPLPALGPNVAAATAIRYIGVRADTDRKTVLTVDPATYDASTSLAPKIIAGGDFAALARTRNGVLVAKEIATDFEVRPGDPLPLTIFPDDEEKKRNVTFRVVGVYSSFPPVAPPAEMVMTTTEFRPFLLPEPEFWLARTLAGHPAASVAGELHARGIDHAFAITTAADRARAGQRTLATLNLTGLSRIESLGGVLIAAVGVAVLGAFVVLERRREFAILTAVGTDTPRLLVAPAQEGALAVLGSVLVGVPLGLGLGMLAVRVLSLFFTLPPPVVAVDGGSLVAFVALMCVASAAALGAALVAITRIGVAEVLREP
jgi:putative ABC transport system permease protein